MSDQNSDQGRLLEEYFFLGRGKSAREQAELVREIGKIYPGLAAQLSGMFGSPTGTPDRSISDAATPGPIDLATNAEFGNCLIVKEIGAGGMGAVYLVLDQVNRGRPSALKILKPAMLDGDGLRRFEQETAALALLEHANIARLYRPGVQRWNDADRPYFVMEYIDGRTLDRHVAEHYLSVDQRLDILEKICLAVDYGHRRNVFHRDLKPGNILVTAAHEPKIIDYGISHVAEPDSEGAADGQRHERSGTIAYMAPETAGGIQGAPDARTDVYSLGIIAFELFAGRRPMLVLPSGQLVELDSKESASSNMRLVADCDREFLGDADPKIPEDLEIIIAKALCRDVSGRYSNAGELALEFQRVRDRQPIQARPKSRIYDTRMFVRRNPTLVAALVTVFLLTVVAAAALAVGEYREAAARREIQQQVVAAHFRSADIDEQRGNWAGAVEEYRAICNDPAQNNLTLNVRELRALGRLKRFAEATSLIDRIRLRYPDADKSQPFAFVRGFVLWSTDPAKSTTLITQALSVRPAAAESDRLALADRAFARGLITPDMHVAAASFREAVRYDSFDHDAWSLLALCDLALGDSQRSEQDAVVLRHFFPDSGAGGVLAAIAAAFQGRHESCVAYLDSCTGMRPDVKSSIADTMDFVSGLHSSMDDLRSQGTVTLLINHLPGLSACARQLTGSYSLPAPIAFKGILDHITRPAVLLFDQDAAWKFAAQWPNGDGEFATGWLALRKGDWVNSAAHLRRAIAMPSLIDCRRVAAMSVLLVEGLDLQQRKVAAPQVATAVGADIKQIIDFGGVTPDRFSEEWVILAVVLKFQQYAPLRQMSLAVLARVPDDPQAMYYFACADANLNDKAEARVLFDRAIVLGLADPMLTDARRQAAVIAAAASTTRPNATPLGD